MKLKPIANDLILQMIYARTGFIFLCRGRSQCKKHINYDKEMNEKGINFPNLFDLYAQNITLCDDIIRSVIGTIHEQLHINP